jgi:site-specific DNA-adenine methylase
MSKKSIDGENEVESQRAKDFRSLIKRYNRPDVLLYLDPPYLRRGD